MFRRLYCQRRRLLLSAFFVALGLFATLSRHSDALLDGMELVWWGPAVLLSLTSLIMALLYAGLGAALILLLPDWRGLIEIMALTFFADAMLAFALPAYFGIDSASGFGILTWFCLYMLIFSLIYGSLLDRFRLWLGYGAQRSFVSPLSPGELWRRMVLGQAPLSDFYDPLLAEAEPDGEDPESFEIAYRHGHSFFEHQTITYLDRQPEQRFR